MKLYVRGVSALVLTLLLSISITPVADAAARDRDDFQAKIVKVIKTLQRLIGFESGPLPPVP